MSEPAVRSVAHARWLFRILGPLSLIWVFYRLDSPAAVAHILRGASGWLVGLALLLNLVNVELKVERWRRLLRERGIEYDRPRARVAFLSSCYAGFLTPGRVGDVLRAEYLRRDRGVPFSEGVLSVVVDRVCDVAALALCVALSLLHLHRLLSPEIATLGWALVFASAVAMLVFVLLSLRRPAAVPGGASARPSVRTVLASLQSFPPRALVVPMALTFVTFAVTFVQGFLLARAIGVPIAIEDVSALLSAATFLGLLPVSISGIGIREALFGLVFPARGFDAGVGVALGILVFVVIYGGVALLGLVVGMARPPLRQPRDAS